MNAGPTGFFSWLREGVRRAVLLGFSDAVNEIGNRSEDEDISPQLAQRLQQSLAVETSEQVPVLTAAPGARKRLGKGLEQLQQSAKTA